MASAKLNETISELEHKTWQAMQKSGKELLPFLSQDCVMLFPLGVQVSQNSEPNIEDILTSEAFAPWDSYEMSKVTVTPIGSDGAAITYTAHATKPGTGDFQAVISSVWRKEGDDGAWKLCVHQQTPYVEDLEA